MGSTSFTTSTVLTRNPIRSLKCNLFRFMAASIPEIDQICNIAVQIRLYVSYACYDTQYARLCRSRAVWQTYFPFGIRAERVSGLFPFSGHSMPDAAHLPGIDPRMNDRSSLTHIPSAAQNPLHPPAPRRVPPRGTTEETHPWRRFPRPGGAKRIQRCRRDSEHHRPA